MLPIEHVTCLPLRFRKARRVWCGGARETHWAPCHDGVTSNKTKEFLKYPYFFRSQWYLKSKKNIFTTNYMSKSDIKPSWHYLLLFNCLRFCMDSGWISPAQNWQLLEIFCLEPILALRDCSLDIDWQFNDGDFPSNPIIKNFSFIFLR